MEWTGSGEIRMALHRVRAQSMESCTMVSGVVIQNTRNKINNVDCYDTDFNANSAMIQLEFG